MSNFLDQFIPANPAQVMDRREIWRGARDGTMPRPDVDTSEADRMADPSIRRGVPGFLLGDNDPNTMNVGEKIGTALNTGGESLTFGLVGDEAAAAADAAIGRGTYDERLQKYRGDEQQFADENPVAYTGALLAPALLPAGAGARAVAATPGLAGKMVASGLLGGAGAGTYGFMEGEGDLNDRRDASLDAAPLGFGIGAAAPGVARLAGMIARGVQGSRASKALIDGAPSLDGLRSQSRAAFARADDAAPVPREAFANAAEEIADATRRIGRRPKTTPIAQDAMDEIMNAANLERGRSIGFSELDELREVAGAAAGARGNAKEAAIGSRIIQGIDDFMDNSPDMGPAQREARALWRQLRTTEMLDEAFEKAGRQASGFENGIRVQFRSILNSDKGKRLPAPVKEAMEQVVSGTAAGNTLRRIARMMGPGAGQQTNMLGLGLSSGAGAAIGSATGIPGAGYVGAFIPGIVGAAAQKGAEQSTVRGAELARALAASGASQLPVPTAAKVNPQLLRALLAASAPTGMAMQTGPQ